MRTWHRFAPVLKLLYADAIRSLPCPGATGFTAFEEEVPLRLAAAVLTTLALIATDRAIADQASADTKTGTPVTLVGRVVDAACYMIHPSAATVTSHKDCGGACIARGVPIAIANETDNVLYFPAPGSETNKQLTDLMGQRVRVTGTVSEVSDPMELKMPVGDKNQMSVRVEGGYKVIAIDRIAKAPAAKPAKGL
jgi:hypothetical protein